MATITTKDGTSIFYKDWGPKDGQPIVFSHGWPLTADAWDTQIVFFANHGYRTIAMMPAKAPSTRPSIRLPRCSVTGLVISPPRARQTTRCIQP